MLESSNIFVTGGAGTFGHALARLRKQQGWTGHLTVYSSDSHKHEAMQRLYPDIHFVQGDIRNPETLYMAMAGHDVVIHAAAAKIIPICEEYALDTIDVNVNGSQVVFTTAIRAHVWHVLAISTDKACRPVNTYGCTKMLMERQCQEYARLNSDTQFHLVRLGNVLESNGSVVEAWRNAEKRGEKLKITDPSMTRFWLSPLASARYVVEAFKYPSSSIYIPKLPALSIGKLAQYVVDEVGEMQIIPIRPGEKKHECLLTEEEGWYAIESKDCYLLAPTTSQRFPTPIAPYTSDIAPELTQEELTQLLEEG